MNVPQNDRADAQQILDALTQVQNDSQLQSEARSNPESVLTKLGLSGIARHAVASAFVFAFAAADAGEAVVEAWWS